MVKKTGKKRLEFTDKGASRVWTNQTQPNTTNEWIKQKVLLIIALHEFSTIFKGQNMMGSTPALNGVIIRIFPAQNFGQNVRFTFGRFSYSITVNLFWQL